MDRIESLRNKAVKPDISYDYWHMLFFRKYSEKGQGDKFEDKYSASFRYAYENMMLSIDDGELIVGKANYKMTHEEQKEFELLQSVADEIAPRVGQDSHMVPDYEKILNKGINGIISDIDEKMQITDDSDKLDFYCMCRNCLESVIVFSERYADYAEAMSGTESNSDRKKELLKIADICRKVPANPAGSFYEAVQAVHFIAFCLSMNPCRYFSNQQFQLGHPDRYLYRFYENDLKSGVITKEEAQVLLDCLGIQINNRVPSGLSCGYMVGGIDRFGNVISNELTHMCMQVVDDIRLVYPSVGLCYTREMGDECLDTACEILSHGRSHPAIFNDKVISEGLRKYGVPENEAHDYIHSTCVEITPEASSNVWVASPYINLPLMLLKSLDREYDSMGSLLDRVFYFLDEQIEIEYNAHTSFRNIRKEKTVNPLLSCFVNDCIEKGIDIEKGGARYNWVMPSFVGMANLIDSLTVIEKLVFEDKKYSVRQIKDMTDADFEGYENIRLEFLNNVPKYGNDDDYADKWSMVITEHIVSECRKYEYCFDEGKMIPSVFCWVMHECFGRETGATPDGRKAGFPLGDGSGAAQGREKHGPTASVISSTKWEHSNFIGGVAVNMKFSKSLFSQSGTEKMKALIKTYIDMNGFEMQINVTDTELLKDARENPKKYSDLVVRIGGYSDYFVRLSPQMQSEVILRTTHEI